MATTVTNVSIQTRRTWKQQITTARIIAGTLLLMLLAQCAFFISHVPMSQVEANYVLRGVAVLRHIDAGADAFRSPLVSAAALVGVLPFGGASQAGDQFWLDQHRWFVRLPFLAAGLLLGASLWFVARRLFGNNAAYIALGIYCFSPGVVARSSLAGPEILGAWGAFGVIFTAIATAHTLYAPREVVLWNWKRIVLLGISIALAVGSQWALAVVLVPGVLFMFWAVPQRRGAAAVIFLAACLVALILLDITYLGDPRAFASGVAHGKVFDFSLAQLARPQMYKLLASFYADASAAACLTVVVALAVFCAWRRARFFGNTAPLIVSGLLIFCGFTMPEAAGATFFFYALPFLILFAAGVFADLLESKRPAIPAGIAYGAVLAQAVYSIVGLMRVFSRGA